jgi:hypothetical protein
MCRLASLLVLCLCTSVALASGGREQAPAADSIHALVAKAGGAPPKEQCFLYAELVHKMTELAGQQVTAGEDATETLRSIHDYAEKIHLGVAQDTKKLKNAQILIERTAFRLKELLHASPVDDRPQLQATVEQLDKVQAELMMQVFRH